MTVLYVLQEVIFSITNLVAAYHRAGMGQGGNMNFSKVAKKLMLPVERA
jgi:hypothetical protein